jgi:hypothetical protein
MTDYALNKEEKKSEAESPDCPGNPETPGKSPDSPGLQHTSEKHKSYRFSI